MENFLEKLFDINKIPTKLIIVIWVSTGLILFIPEQFLTKLELESFLQDYGKFIGISFIVSSAFSFIALWTYFSRLIKRNLLAKKIRNSIKSDIQNLNFHEKALLREFFINGKTTLQLPIDNDTVIGLINKRIIYTASNTGFVYLDGAYYPYTISEFAKKHLTYELIDLPRDPTKEQERQVMQDRPDWAKEKSRIDCLLKSYW